MASHGVQYTRDNTEKGIVSDHAMSQPMQKVQIKGDIPAIREYKDARTSRIKAIGEANQKATSVGSAYESGMGMNANPFHSDFI